jgi:hypothetical protein
VAAAELRALLERHRLLKPDPDGEATAERDGLLAAGGLGALLRLCEAGQLEGGLSVALGVRPDELLGPLLLAMGGAARELKVNDVRDRPTLEVSIRWRDVSERWEVPTPSALVKNLNDLFRAERGVREVLELGEWEDALQLWAVPRALAPRLRRAAGLDG